MRWSECEECGSYVEREVSDPRIHAKVFIPSEAEGPGGEYAVIVRYDRAGKWWYESPTLRRQLTVDEAVQFIDDEAQVFYGVPGGSVFDRKVKAKLDV